METRVQRWGNSLAVRIPKLYATEIGLNEDAPVQIGIEAGKLVVWPIAPRRTLQELLAGVTEENIHGEYDYGPAVGNEAW